MKLNNRLIDIFADKAENVKIDILSIGLGYTAVTTSDRGIGLSYTYFESKNSCSLIKSYNDYQGRPAIELLEKIKGTDKIQRGMALALINALNYGDAILLPEDKNNIMFEKFGKVISKVNDKLQTEKEHSNGKNNVGDPEWNIEYRSGCEI